MVRHLTYGVGRVEAVQSDSIVVDFRDRPRHSMSRSMAGNLARLPADCLAALTWDGPAAIRTWHEDAPLKLLAAVLADIGGTGKAGEIRERLDHGSLLGGKRWNAWWHRVRAAAADSSHFRMIRNKSNAVTGISLVSSAGDVPTEPLPPPPPKPEPRKRGKTQKVSLADWRKWFQNPAPEPPPGRYPTRAANNALSKLPAKDIGYALDRTMGGGAEFLASGNTSQQAAGAWIESVGWTFTRYHELNDPDTVGLLAQQVGELLTRLVVVVDFASGPTEWLLSAGVLPGIPPPRGDGSSRRGCGASYENPEAAPGPYWKHHSPNICTQGV